jgi:hypothetical protein
MIYIYLYFAKKAALTITPHTHIHTRAVDVLKSSKHTLQTHDAKRT